jgi:hypothetical protein
MAEYPETHRNLEKRPASELSGRAANSSAWPIKSDSLEVVKDSFCDIGMTQHLVGEGCGYRGLEGRL